MAYDKEEAIEILANTRAKLDPDSVYRLKSSAADTLFTELSQAATAAGLQARAVPGSILLGHETNQVTFEFRSGFILVSHVTERTSAPVEGIEFDVASKSWRGIQLDTFHHPIPGSPKEYRSAVAVLAEHAAKRFLVQR